MKRPKVLMVVTAFVLAVVGALAVVTSALSATQQSVSTSLQVTYRADNVSATVSVSSRTQSGPFGTETSVTFYPSNGSTTDTLATETVTLGSFVSEGDVLRFQRYAVYKFTFTNNYSASNGNITYGAPLSVTGKYTQGTATNVSILWVAGTIEPVNLAFNADTGLWTAPTGLSVANDDTPFTVTSSLSQAQTTSLYLYVLITDVTRNSTFSIGGAGGGSLAFVLQNVTT